MTVVAAISTKKFAVVVSDTLYSEQGKSRFGRKMVKLDSGIVLGGAGETGPIWRRVETDAKWRAVETHDDFYAKVTSLHEVVDKAQMEVEANNPEDTLVVSVAEGIMITDIYGHRTRGVPIRHGHTTLPASIEAVGCGRNAVLCYVAGFLAAMPLKEARIELQSQSRVEALLREAVEVCGRYDWAVGGPLESHVVR